MKTTNPSSRITISQNGNQILTCKVYKEPNYILSMSNEEILELISGLDYIGNLPTVPDLEKPIGIQVSTTRQIPLEQNKEVQTKIKEIIYNNPSSRITISQKGNQILSCKVYKEPNYILSMSNEEILELISGLDYMGNYLS